MVPDARSRSPRINAVGCTRWEEVRSAVEVHAELCAILRAPCVFRMTNDPGRPYPQQLSVAEGASAGEEELEKQVGAVRETFLRATPNGASCLSRHLRAVHDSVEAMADRLRGEGQRVAFVLVTDSIPTNEHGEESEAISDEFMDVLRKFAALPVWITIRLSTDEDRVLDFYNGIDRYFSQLGPDISVDVLDDFVGEAREVRSFNPWLNYALPLHLVRESGMSRISVLNDLDEKSLRPYEVGALCSVLLGFQGDVGVVMPHADVDWDGFVEALQRRVTEEKEQWDSVKERMLPWVNIKELNKTYGGGGGANRGGGGLDVRERGIVAEPAQSKCCVIM